MLCDLSSPKQIRSVAAEYKSRHGRLHVLVNNAAVVPAKRTLTEDGLEMQFTVNHLAYFLLTNLLLDTLIASAPSRIVNVTSGMHKIAALDFDNLQGEKTYKTMKHYSLTKLLNIFFTYELARRLEGTSVTVNCLAPGFTATGLGRDFSAFSQFVMKTMGKKKEEGARTVVYLASSPDVATVTGKYFEKGKESRSSEETHDLEIARRMWNLSEKMTRSA
jgi:NAD(P)-dependent dehydrogenase (short-subunit alcohol dehydrogenase family)